MKEPRTEKIVEELRTTVERLNKLDSILRNMGVSYTLYRSRNDEPYILTDVEQKVKY